MSRLSQFLSILPFTSFTKLVSRAYVPCSGEFIIFNIFDRKRKRSTETDMGGNNKKRFEKMEYIQRACFG
jgi:hypothetical protein